MPRTQVLATIITNTDALPPLAASANLPFADIGTAYAGSITGIGGAGGYSYSVVSKPSWATATTVGGVLEITGTTGAGGEIKVTVTDAALDTYTATFRINTGYSIQPPRLPPGDVRGSGTSSYVINTSAGASFAYDTSILLRSPTLPVSYAISGNPATVDIDVNTGVIAPTGTTVAGTHIMTVTATDADGAVAVLPIKLVVYDVVTFEISGESLGLDVGLMDVPPIHRGTPYRAQIIASGGLPPYAYSFVADDSDVATGIEVDPRTGLISGTTYDDATGAIQRGFSVQVRDALGYVAVGQYQYDIRNTQPSMSVMVGGTGIGDAGPAELDFVAGENVTIEGSTASRKRTITINAAFTSVDGGSPGVDPGTGVDGGSP